MYLMTTSLIRPFLAKDKQATVVGWSGSTRDVAFTCVLLFRREFLPWSGDSARPPHRSLAGEGASETIKVRQQLIQSNSKSHWTHLAGSPFLIRERGREMSHCECYWKLRHSVNSHHSPTADQHLHGEVPFEACLFIPSLN